MDIQIINEYGYQEDYSYLNDVISLTLKHEKVKNAIFSLIFVDEDKIQEINKNYRHIDKVTDVISFAFEDNQSITYTDFRLLGDIYICIPRMLEQAKNYGHSNKRELSFLTIHGLLHLLGYDHQEREEEQIMFQKQDLILEKANITR